MQLITSVSNIKHVTNWRHGNLLALICNLLLAFWQELSRGMLERKDISHYYYYHNHYCHYYHYHYHRYFLRNSLFSQAPAIIERVFKSFSVAMRQLLSAHIKNLLYLQRAHRFKKVCIFEFTKSQSAQRYAYITQTKARKTESQGGKWRVSHSAKLELVQS